MAKKQKITLDRVKDDELPTLLRILHRNGLVNTQVETYDSMGTYRHDVTFEVK